MDKRFGEYSYWWRGDDVSKATVHEYVRRHNPPPSLCEDCGLIPPMDLANITGIYGRARENWKYLCRKCHIMSEGRLNNLWWNKMERSPRWRDRDIYNSYCTICGSKKTYIRTRNGVSKPEWATWNGSIVCSNCYKKERRLKPFCYIDLYKDDK